MVKDEPLTIVQMKLRDYKLHDETDELRKQMRRMQKEIILGKAKPSSDAKAVRDCLLTREHGQAPFADAIGNLPPDAFDLLCDCIQIGFQVPLSAVMQRKIRQLEDANGKPDQN